MLLGHCKYTDMYWVPAVLPPPPPHGAASLSPLFAAFCTRLNSCFHDSDVNLEKIEGGKVGPRTLEGTVCCACEHGLANHRLMEDQALLLLLLLILPCRTSLTCYWKMSTVTMAIIISDLYVQCTSLSFVGIAITEDKAVIFSWEVHAWAVNSVNCIWPQLR